MRLFVFMFPLLLYILPAVAASRTRIEAEAIAREFLQERMSEQVLQTRSTYATGASTFTSQAFARALLVRSGNAFVLVANDEDDPDILGYGSVGETMPPVLRALLAGNRASGLDYPPAGVEEWEEVEPLLTTVRHQSDPYNRSCPYYIHSDGTVSEERCQVGCVATAMEQILTFHRRTVTLLDTLHGWETTHYTISDVLPGTTVDTKLIRDDYDTEECTDEEIDAVADLSYYLGVACGMQWGLSSSGASTDDLVEPLASAFGMKYVVYLDPYKYAPADLWNFIAAEIAASRPVYYSGSIMATGGHAFVLDGLDDDGLFHVNWGYGGEYDGFFRLDVLCHTQPAADRLDTYVENGFFCNQEALAVSPDEQPDVVLPTELERTGYEVVIDSIAFGQAPMTNRYTSVEIYIRNTADEALLTTLVLLENLPSDTSIVAQGEWLNLSGCTLEAGESRMLTVHTIFTRSDTILLSILQDAGNVLYSGLTYVTEGEEQSFEISEPEVSFPAEDTVVISEQITNASDEERAAQAFLYDLSTSAGEAIGIYYHYLYIDAGETLSDTAIFTGLSPGETYVLSLRERWPVVQEKTFTMPSSTSIPSLFNGGEACLPTDEEVKEKIWFTLSGRRIPTPRSPGVYIRRKDGIGEKVIVSGAR